MARFDEEYQRVMREIMENGIEEVNQRTGHKVKSLPGMTIEVEGDEGFPALTLRSIPIKIFVAEQIWFISGGRSIDQFIEKHTKIWNDFTNPAGVVTAAYGFRWRRHFKRDQLGKLVELLQKDPSSRHGVVVAWDPASDGLEPKQVRKNVPCPFTFVVNIIGGKLNMHNIIRSNDMILGAPHDAAGFALLQRFLAAKLGVEVGKYTHSIAHAHVYDIHYHAAEELINRDTSHKPIDLQLNPDDYDRAEKGDDDLVEEIVGKIRAQYEPQEPIKDIPIVL